MNNQFLISVILLVFNAMLLSSSRAQNADAPASAAKVPSAPNADKLYVLAFNDVVQMKVYQEEDLTTQVRIGKDGSVTLPLLGTVVVGGKTIEQATTLITGLLDKDYLVKPQVSLTIFEYSKRRFTVLGQVQRPGTYEMPNEEEVTLQQAIAMAGGYTRIGAPWKITVQRVVDGEQKILKLNAEAMDKDKKAKPFTIKPDDTITVGEKLI
jgi:protein involved in polysaccharide export with SLBB domain